jgi:hypothetical protein
MLLNYRKNIYEIMSLEPIQHRILVHWTYTRDEWKAFLKWENWKKGIFRYIYYSVRLIQDKIVLVRDKKVPEVLITASEVIINKKSKSFISRNRQIKRMIIRDVGPFNIIEIIYENSDKIAKSLNEIYIPVPKGKLKEAIHLQELLVGH